MQLGIKDNVEIQRYRYRIIRLLVELKSKGKINPNYKEDMKNVETILLYVDKSVKGFNTLDSILYDFDSFKKDVRKYHITESIFMSIYGDLLLYYFLNLYSLLENALVALLLGVSYQNKNKELKIKGTETLGQLIDIIRLFYPQHGLDPIIDVNFRNALAHRWYYFKNNQLVYFTNGSLKVSHTMELVDLLRKFRLLNLFVIALDQALFAEWTS
jgi:hypothetical protein